VKRRKRKTELLTYYGGEPVARVKPHLSDSFPLAATKPGDRLWIDKAIGSLGIGCCKRLGLIQGAMIRVISVRPSGSVVFAIDAGDGQQIGVGAALALQIWVNRDRQPTAKDIRADPLTTKREGAEIEPWAVASVFNPQN